MSPVMHASLDVVDVDLDGLGGACEALAFGDDL